MSIYDNAFIKFYTTGSRRLGEPGTCHGQLVDIYKPEKNIGYKIKIMPSWKASLLAKILPSYNPYIILPTQEDAIFMSSLFNMSMEELIYRASSGIDINLYYAGSYNTGDPMVEEFNSSLTMDRLVLEKEAYKLGLYKCQNDFTEYIKHPQQIDRASLENIMQNIDRIKKSEQKPISHTIKGQENQDSQEGIRMKEAERGSGILADIMKHKGDY